MTRGKARTRKGTFVNVVRPHDRPQRKGAALTADCVKYNLSCPANFTSSHPLAMALKPFPFQSVSDSFGQYMANSSDHAVQALLSNGACRRVYSTME